MKYYKQYKDNGEELIEVSYEEALNTLLTAYKDNDMTRDMLKVENAIPTMFSNIFVKNDE